MINPRNIVMLYLPAFLFIVQPTASHSADPPEPVKPKDAAASKYPSDNDKLDGDRLTLEVTVSKFKKVNGASTDEYCAPKGAKISVRKTLEDKTISLRFISVPKEDPEFLTCPKPNLVDLSTQYVISESDLNQYDYKRSGVAFGALLVPFKFYLGGDKKIGASSTVAPYVGWSNSLPFGLTWTPILSAGLGLVPVADPSTGQTDTKAAFSTAAGFLLTSNKNKEFNAGFLFGKDFLSNQDRQNDPTVSKVWFSFYVGYSM